MMCVVYGNRWVGFVRDWEEEAPTHKPPPPPDPNNPPQPATHQWRCVRIHRSNTSGFFRLRSSFSECSHRRRRTEGNGTLGSKRWKVERESLDCWLLLMTVVVMGG